MTRQFWAKGEPWHQSLAGVQSEAKNAKNESWKGCVERKADPYLYTARSARSLASISRSCTRKRREHYGPKTNCPGVRLKLADTVLAGIPPVSGLITNWKMFLGMELQTYKKVPAGLVTANKGWVPAVNGDFISWVVTPVVLSMEKTDTVLSPRLDTYKYWPVG